MRPTGKPADQNASVQQQILAALARNERISQQTQQTMKDMAQKQAAASPSSGATPFNQQRSASEQAASARAAQVEQPRNAPRIDPASPFARGTEAPKVASAAQSAATPEQPPKINPASPFLRTAGQPPRVTTAAEAAKAAGSDPGKGTYSTTDAFRAAKRDPTESAQDLLNTKDPFKILGVGRDASEEEIKAAHRRRQAQFHPDRNQGEGEAEAQAVFNKVQNAYQFLNNPKVQAARKMEREKRERRAAREKAAAEPEPASAAAPEDPEALAPGSGTSSPPPPEPPRTADAAPEYPEPPRPAAAASALPQGAAMPRNRPIVPAGRGRRGSGPLLLAGPAGVSDADDEAAPAGPQSASTPAGGTRQSKRGDAVAAQVAGRRAEEEARKRREGGYRPAGQAAAAQSESVPAFQTAGVHNPVHSGSQSQPQPQPVAPTGGQQGPPPQSFGSAMGGFASWAGGGILKGIDSALGAVGRVADKMAGGLADMGKGTAIDKETALPRAVGKTFQGAIRGARGTYRSGKMIGKKIGSTAKTGAKFGSAVGGKFGGAVGGTVGAVAGAAMGAASALTMFTKEMAGSVPVVIGTFKDVTNAITPMVQAFSPSHVLVFQQAIRDVNAVIGSALAPALEGATMIVKDWGSALLPVMQALRPVVAEVTGVFVSLGQTFSQTFGSVLGSLMPAIRFTADLFSAISPAIHGTMAAFGGLVEVVVVAGKGLLSMFGIDSSSLTKGIRGAFEQLTVVTLTAAASLTRLVSASASDAFMAGALRALKGAGDKQDITGFATAQNAQLTNNVTDFSKAITRAALLATTTGSGEVKRNNISDLIAEVEKQFTSLKSGQDTVIDKMASALAKAIVSALGKGGEQAGKKVYDTFDTVGDYIGTNWLGEQIGKILYG